MGVYYEESCRSIPLDTWGHPVMSLSSISVRCTGMNLQYRTNIGGRDYGPGGVGFISLPPPHFSKEICFIYPFLFAVVFNSN